MCNFVQLKFFGVQDFCPGSVLFKFVVFICLVIN